ncbi:MAG: ATP-binding protein [Sandaracinaceae bacterium]
MALDSTLRYGRSDDYTVDRVRWIIGLRWVALLGIVVAATLSSAGFYPGVNWKVLFGAAVVAGAYNLYLSRRQARAGRAGAREAIRQAVFDLGLLTLVLWAAGGMRTPFISYYVFHVAIVSILGDRRATVVAGLAALAGSFLLLLTEHLPGLQIGRWDPTWPWDVFAELMAFGTTIGAMAYLVTHAADELRLRERALAQARDQAALELEVLVNTLDELQAGLEVVERDGAVLWRNRRAEELALQTTARWVCPGEERPCEHDTLGVCPVSEALAEGQTGQCRFAASVDGEERIFEMTVFPLGTGPRGRARVMNLYIDRTQSLMHERRLLFAERLASLGRVTQGVAHELNTPLATIRTLAADLVATLRTSVGSSVGTPTETLLDDLRESAELMQDETRRLGRITQGLLTGRDLTASKIQGAVPLLAVVERARALVFSGSEGGGIDVMVDEALASHAVAADPDHLVQVLVNLLQNAYDAVRDAEGRGTIRVHAHSGSDTVVILVDDDGPGLSPEVQKSLFEPFTSTKPPGQGTGLGLYTSYRLVTAMRGRLHLANRDEGGARAEIHLPAPERNLVTLRTRAEARGV